MMAKARRTGHGDCPPRRRAAPPRSQRGRASRRRKPCLLRMSHVPVRIQMNIHNITQYNGKVSFMKARR